MDLEQIYQKLPTQKDCFTFLEMCFWNNNPNCPYCDSKKHTILKKENRYRCNNCITSYSVTVGTMFHNTKLDMQKWFQLFLIINSGQIMSYRQLSINLNVNKNTAMRMKNQVKKTDYEYKLLVCKISELLT